MKTVVLAMLFLTTAAVAEDNVSVAGKWKVHSSIAGNDSDSSCTFAQKGADLTGSCVSDQGTMQITGKVDGKKVNWSFKSDYNGTPLTVSYAGTLADGKIKGETNVDPFGVGGDFTATPDK